MNNDNSASKNQLHPGKWQPNNQAGRAVKLRRRRHQNARGTTIVSDDEHPHRLYGNGDEVGGESTNVAFPPQRNKYSNPGSIFRRKIREYAIPSIAGIRIFRNGNPAGGLCSEMCHTVAILSGPGPTQDNRPVVGCGRIKRQEN